MQQLFDEFSKEVYGQIPILKAMGMEFGDYDGENLSLEFPLALNINDKGTGFAGSLNAAATFCSWALVRLLVEEKGFKPIVAIVSSQVEYRKPITQNFFVKSSLPSSEKVNLFLGKLRDKGKGSIALESRIKQGHEVAVSFSATYVALPE